MEKSVRTPRLEVQEAMHDWYRTECALAGRSKILQNADLFLHVTEAQKLDTEMYKLYCNRALWYNATSRTLDAWVGTLCRKAMTAKVPNAFKARLTNIDERGTDIDSFARTVVRELCAYGRYAIVVDAAIAEDDVSATDIRATPWLTGYNCNSILDWRHRRTAKGIVLDQIILLEVDEQPHPSGFGVQRNPMVRVLELDAKGYCRSRTFIFRDGGELEYPAVYLTKGGRPLDYVPAVIFGSSSLSADIQKAPLLDIVNVNASHYQNSADMAFSQYWSASPTAVITGLSDDDTATRRQVGGGALWNLPPGTNAYYMEFKGPGLDSIRQDMLDKREMMASLGSGFLSVPKREAETAEALTIKTSAESASLVTIADVVSQALTKCVKMACDWSSISGPVRLELNRDLINVRLKSDDLKTLVYMVQSGLLSLDDYFYQLQQGEILRPGVTIDDAKALMQTQPPITSNGFDAEPRSSTRRKSARNTESGDGTSPTSKPTTDE